jgi:hypothetical protein
MRKLLLTAVGAVAMATASMAGAAVTVGGGTSSSGSNIVLGTPDNTTFPETFTFDTNITDNGVGNPYTSSFTFSNDLVGYYIFAITTSVLNGTITLEKVEQGANPPLASNTGSGPFLSLTTPVLDANTDYKFTYTSSVPSSGKVSGNASFYAVPEPSTWAMMLLGFTGIGMAMRRRRRPALAQVA